MDDTRCRSLGRRCYRWLSLTARCAYTNINSIPASHAVPFLGGAVAVSLCWTSDTEEGKWSVKVKLLLAADEFLFEDLPRYSVLLSIWANAGAVWFLWLDYLCISRHVC